MSQSQIETRYAKSFYYRSIEDGCLDQVTQDMSLLHDVFSNKKLRLFFEKSGTKQKTMLGLLTPTLDNKVHQSTGTFFRFLATKHRLNYFPGIIRAFLSWVDVCKGIRRVDFTSAYPVKDDFEKILTKQVKQKIDKNCDIKIHVDSKLVGGFRLRVGDKTFDCSVASQLKNIAKAITQ